jgi:ribonucleoside-diphosphate reductase alpha chain
MYVEHRYDLPTGLRAALKARAPRFGFNGLGETTFYRSYSRPVRDEHDRVLGQEDWADVVSRVITGTLSIARDTALRHQGLAWDAALWDEWAWRMAEMMFEMKWLPPGRGLWLNGTPYIYERGAMGLYNCCWCDTRATRSLSEDAEFIMDALMCGVGVGFAAQDRGLRMPGPERHARRTHVIADSREGWTDSVRQLIASYELGGPVIDFDYSMLRPKGSPIRGFGGVASGPDPLIELHERIRDFCEHYLAFQEGKQPDYIETRLIADVVNAIGVAVVAGNVRRSAEIMLGNMNDPIFADLKNPERFPERGPWMFLSNNSVRLYDDQDFAQLPAIADRIRANGEPGFLNMINIKNYGRFGDAAGTEILPGYMLPFDRATGINPCAEIPLESYETCVLSEVFLTRCDTDAEILEAMECATMYATIVQWLPTHRPETNAVNARNRRIGVSLSGVFDWYEREGMSRLVRMMRDGYRHVRATNAALADQFGMRRAIRVTTIKPSGSISKLAGCSSGIHAPEYTHYVRRIRLDAQWPGRSVLDAAGIPSEPEVNDPERTTVYEFPIHPEHEWSVRTVDQVSMWEQAMLVMSAQRHWADNAVSVTLKFDPRQDGKDIEHLLALVASNVKSLSMMPIFKPEVKVLRVAATSDAGQVILQNGEPVWEESTLWDEEALAQAMTIIAQADANDPFAPHVIKKVPYAQLPEEPITPEEYQRRLRQIRPLQWSGFVSHDDGAGERYCTGEACEVDLTAIRARAGYGERLSATPQA